MVKFCRSVWKAVILSGLFGLGVVNNANALFTNTLESCLGVGYQPSWDPSIEPINDKRQLAWGTVDIWPQRCENRPDDFVLLMRVVPNAGPVTMRPIFVSDPSFSINSPLGSFILKQNSSDFLGFTDAIKEEKVFILAPSETLSARNSKYIIYGLTFNAENGLTGAMHQDYTRVTYDGRGRTQKIISTYQIQGSLAQLHVAFASPEANVLENLGALPTKNLMFFAYPTAPDISLVPSESQKYDRERFRLFHRVTKKDSSGRIQYFYLTADELKQKVAEQLIFLKGVEQPIDMTDAKDEGPVWGLLVPPLRESVSSILPNQCTDDAFISTPKTHFMIDRYFGPGGTYLVTRRVGDYYYGRGSEYGVKYVTPEVLASLEQQGWRYKDTFCSLFHAGYDF